jgi:hypothetical protein
MLPETTHKGRFSDLAEVEMPEIPEICQSLRNRKVCLLRPFIRYLDRC